MKIAYCIICHKNNNILRTTINLLYKKNDIFLHIDKKSNIDDFKEYKDKVIFIQKRETIQWGHFSQIRATLNLLEEAVKYDYNYISLISGDCLIVKNENIIKEKLSENNGIEFIGIQNDFNEKDLVNRVKYKHKQIYYKKNKNKLEHILIEIDKILRLRRSNKYYDRLPKLYKGCNWFTITTDLAKYILEYLKQNPYYEEAFKDSYCGDEIFFQTIVMNSKYKSSINKLSNNNIDDNFMALRYIDWHTGPEYPRNLNESDFDIIKKSECIIARKFSDDLNIELYLKTFNIL